LVNFLFCEGDNLSDRSNVSKDASLTKTTLLLADNSEASKIIMAGLVIKEMKLREAIEKILIILSAVLRIQ
jgi:hypothetical protein